MKTLIRSLMVAFTILIFSEISYAIEILKQPPAEAIREMRDVTKKVFDKAITPAPKDAVKVLRYLNLLARGGAKDPEIMAEITKRAGIGVGVSKVLDAGISIMSESFEKKTGIDKYQFELLMKSAKNVIIGDVKGQVVDATSVVYDSWKETAQAIKDLPSDAPMDDQLRTLQQMVKGADALKKEKPYLSPLVDVYMFKEILPMAFAEGARIIAKETYQKFKGFFGTKTALAPSDASKLKEGTPHQLVTPTKVEFTQTYDGLFTQSADFVGSRYGSYSGSLTDGARVNSIGDSRAGDFTGSFSGRTVAEPGYTPITHNNRPFSGSSVGKVSAVGFKEGDLRGTMTVTVPAGTQTVNVTGNITIKTDGSLSMPSYTGPVTDNASGAKVGTMTGSWSQSKTR